MYKTVSAFVLAIPQILNAILLLACIVFIFAIVGMNTFGGTGLRDVSREHFDSFAPAVVSVINAFSLGFVEAARHCAAEVGMLPTVAYFSTALVVGYLGIMNLFVAILVETFTASDDAGDGGEASDAVPGRVSRDGGDESGRGGGGDGQQASVGSEEVAPLVDFSRRVANEPWLENCVLVLVIASSICLVIDTPRLDRDSDLAAALRVLNGVFIAAFTCEAAIKMVGAGGARAYFLSWWNCLDFFIVTTSLISVLEAILEGFIGYDMHMGREFRMLRILRILRVLRPLRLLTRNEGMRFVIETIVETMPAVLTISAFMLALMVVFSIVGMHLFMGTLASCTDPAILTRADCHPPGEASVNRTHRIGEEGLEEAVALAAATNKTVTAALSAAAKAITRRALRGGSSSGGLSAALRARMSGGPEWVNPQAGSFDSFGQSMLSLFVAMTGDNMPDLLWAAMDARGVGVAPVRTDESPASIFFILWLVVGTFMALNLFVGAIVDSFADQRRRQNGTLMMTAAQVEWVLLMREAKGLQPLRRPHPPPADGHLAAVRIRLYRAALSRELEYAVYSVILVHIGLLACDHYGIREEPYFAAYDGLNTACRWLYALEFAVKVGGLGVAGYFQSGTRQFEFALLMATAIEGSTLSQNVPPMVLRMLRLARIARVLRLLRHPRVRELREMLKKIVLAAPAILNVLSVMSLVVFIYATLGMQLFTFVKRGESLNEFANFEAFGPACLLLFQCLAGDGWYALMLDAMVDEEHGCTPPPAAGAAQARARARSRP